MKKVARNEALLIDFIIEMYDGVSRQRAKEILAHQQIKINDVITEGKATILINVGDLVEIDKKSKSELVTAAAAEKNKLRIVYEDDQILLAIKPAGIITSKDRKQPNLISFHKVIEDFLEHREQKHIRIWSVHRLDKEVEGIVLFAKSEEIQNQIKDQWSDVTKKYLALTEHRPKENEGVIENWLMDSYKQKVVSFANEVENSRFAKTEYRFKETIGMYHLLEVTLHTGRKNQIRVHLSEMGCSIVGDYKYGASNLYKRQIRLAAVRLQLNHPISGKPMTFEYLPSKNFFNPRNADEKYKK